MNWSVSRPPRGCKRHNPAIEASQASREALSRDLSPGRLRLRSPGDPDRGAHRVDPAARQGTIARALYRLSRNGLSRSYRSFTLHLPSATRPRAYTLGLGQPNTHAVSMVACTGLPG